MRTATGVARMMTSMVGAAEADEPALQLESRSARLRASRSYGLILLLVLGSLVFTGLVRDGAWVQSVLVLLLATLLIVALRSTGVARLRSYPIATLLAFAALVALSPLFTGGRTLDGALALIDAALVGPPSQ